MTHVYLTRSDVKLGFSQGQLVIKREADGSDYRLPFCNVESINVFGSPQLSTQLVRECLLSNVPIGYYSEDGHYFGKAVSLDHADPFRQRRQILLTCDEDFCLTWAKIIVGAKIKNSLAFLSSMNDVYGYSTDETSGMAHSLRCVAQASSVDEVLGFEGNAAKCYFRCYAKLFSVSAFSFEGRNSRPPKDPVNALLSYGYSFMHRNIIGAIERHGLHPYFGFMHKIKRGHAALSSDLVEECRALIVDRLVLELVRSSDITPDDFTIASTGAVYMTKPLLERVTDSLSDAMAERGQYFQAYGDGYRYGFHAALDKKLCSVIDAVDSGDATKYRPFLWNGA